MRKVQANFDEDERVLKTLKKQEKKIVEKIEMIEQQQMQRMERLGWERVEEKVTDDKMVENVEKLVFPTISPPATGSSEI